MAHPADADRVEDADAHHLEKIAAREQAIAASAEDLRAQIQNLPDRLRDLDAEAGDLATARKVILALGEDEPTPATHPAVPDNPVYQHILTVLTGAAAPRRTRELCRDLDLGTGTSTIEGMRSKLKRLVATGLVTEDAPGLSAPPRPRTTDEAPGQHPPSPPKDESGIN